jgi:hypothetical protein
MEGDDLWAEKVGAGCEVRESDRVLALVGNQSVDSPGFCGGIVTCFGKLDPNVSGSVGRGRCDVNNDWAFVGLWELINATGYMRNSDNSLRQ